MRPYFDDGQSTIYCGDMREIVPLLDPADAIITDPPYGETRLAWDTWPAGWPRLLLDLAPHLWCFGSMRMFLEQMTEFAGWKFAQDLVWEKHNGSSLLNDRFRRVHEHAVHFFRGDWAKLYKCPPVVTVQEETNGKKVVRGNKPQHFGGSEAGAPYAYDGKRLMRSVLSVRSCHGYAEHPTQKPEALVRPLIEYSVPPGGVVLDPFMGSGTTLRVAKDLGRRAVGIDGDEAHCEIAARRLQQGALAL